MSPEKLTEADILDREEANIPTTSSSILPTPISYPATVSYRIANTWLRLIASGIIAILFIHILHIKLRPIDVVEPARPTPPPVAEAYVTFLAHSDDPRPWYFNAVRRLMFQLKYDPLTLDPHPKDFVVITTPGVPEWQLEQLREEGAIIAPRPLIDHLPLPENGISRYAEVYTKLFIFNLTDYERVLFVDADQLMVKPLTRIWDDPNAWPESGMAACGESKSAWDHPTPIEDQNYFNSGFMLARPDEKTFNELLQEKDFDPWLPEQNLLNHYFRRDGPRPWRPLNHMFVTTFPRKVDLEAGIHVLHDKMWLAHLDREVKEVWRQKLGRMEGYWLAMDRGPEAWNSTSLTYM
ncbi:glycosyl transferase family 8 protein [Cryptococcus neoformans]|nr:glycosyl transferase family 8 protein [Cryptococcus neoformans var. grubii]OXC62253.1 glycosyl transferase family 8 protein [Cryptococcus neoformans var. grubii MW-RSA852]